MAHQKFGKYFMAHQYMHKVFHDPHKNPLPLPPPLLSYILNVRSLILISSFLTEQSANSTSEVERNFFPEALLCTWRMVEGVHLTLPPHIFSVQVKSQSMLHHGLVSASL